MNKNRAIDLAIESLEYEAEEVYDAGEILGDYELEQWQKEKYKAIDFLQTLKD